jgi:hypothetical protein
MTSPIPERPVSWPKLLWLTFICIVSSPGVWGQKHQFDTLKPPGVRLSTAGSQYSTSRLHQLLWGKHYRKEWATPVSVPVFYLDTAAGGLTPYQAGGGRQSKTLRLWDTARREYVLRSIDKSFGGALPPIFRNTFVERLINDQASIAHPFSAITIPDMAHAAGIYHTNPRIVYVPQQEKLDSFNQSYGNALYLFEQRPDENWETAPNFGQSHNIIGTEKLQEHMLKNSKHRVDQLAFLRARLFDIFLGDWGRHEDQWRWAKFEQDDRIVYKPIPRDRDQAYTKFDGLLLQTIMSMAGLKHLQTFDSSVRSIATYNFPARHLDRQLANEPTLSDWLAIATDLRQAINDSVIENAVKKLPPELYSYSGPKIAAILKGRRNNLLQFASDYYHFLAQEVEITGTSDRDWFEVKRLEDNRTQVNVYPVAGNNIRGVRPYYSRVFTAAETKEIRLYGIEGQDVFVVSGTATGNILVRIIGGPGHDQIKDSSVGRKKTVLVYDNYGNTIEAGAATKLMLSNDPDANRYQYDGFHYSKKGLKPVIFYNREDRLYAGIGYSSTRYKWRRNPFAHAHGIYARYSLVQNAVSFAYQGDVNQFWGKWNLRMIASYDPVRWTNFFGIGNNTTRDEDARSFYRMRTSEQVASVGINRDFGKYLSVEAAGFYQAVRILDDKDRFVAHYFKDDQQLMGKKYFAGGRLGFSLGWLNDNVLPSKGIVFNGNVTHTKGVHGAQNDVTRYGGTLSLYVPLLKRLVLVSRSGAATLTGTPQFFQLNSIGGSQTLRGFARDRFWGNTAVYNSNELQWIFDFRSFLFNGKAGLVGLYDVGRVWHPGEVSKIWHPGFGGGFLVAPFNKAALSLTYGFSEDGGRVHFRFAREIKPR